MAKQPVAPDRIAVVDGRLIIDVALTEGTPSGSGKNLVFFTTGGNVSINGGFKLGVNLYKKP